MGLKRALGSGPVALDTAIFIYFIEEHPVFCPLVAPLFAEADAGRRWLVTSALTLLEVLVVPYRAGNRPLAERYEGLLVSSRGLRLVDIDSSQLRAAALLRATVPIRTPDALQVAAAISASCSVFVTNDRAIPQIPGLHVLQLRDFVQDG